MADSRTRIVVASRLSMGGEAVGAVVVCRELESCGAGGVALACGLESDGALEEVARFSIAESDLTLGARFAPFPVVQEFVSMLIGAQPDAVRVERLSGLSQELARLAAALGFEVDIRLPEAARLPARNDPVAWRWLRGGLLQARTLLPAEIPRDEAVLRDVLADLPASATQPQGDAAADAVPPLQRVFGYEAYAFGQRDHGLLHEMQRGFAGHFSGCEKVLDVGCGTGVFLEILARAGILATGIERNPMSARYAVSLGHDVVVGDALAYLEGVQAQWDGVYCSHFIEHLPFELADRLVGDVARALRPGGVAVFVFPDPESIRSQLLGFWRDPEHVRFYHPGLVAAMGQVHGLALEFDSQRLPGREVVPFSMEPPLKPSANPPVGWRQRLFGRLGLATAEALRRERDRVDQLEAALRALWTVNQTWAWEDNAVLRFRKQGSG